MPSLRAIDSLQSIGHVLFHRPAHERRGAASRASLAALPATHAVPTMARPSLMMRESLPLGGIISWEAQRRHL